MSANKLREKVLHPLLDRLEIPRGGFHSLRHGAASALLADGATPAVVWYMADAVQLHRELKIHNFSCHSVPSQNTRSLALKSTEQRNGISKVWADKMWHPQVPSDQYGSGLYFSPRSPMVNPLANRRTKGEDNEDTQK
jgi:hypothetical protein